MPLGVQWSEVEDIRLAIAWLQMSEDASLGVEQKNSTFWENVFTKFNENFLARSAAIDGKDKKEALADAKKRNRSPTGNMVLILYIARVYFAFNNY
tara:strand:- start:1019 stop:1306 length:288 start_codon:yes stop_codon:yes gene_type:complete